MEHRCSSIACTTAAVPPTAGQLVTSERGVCGGPLAIHYANLMSHTAFRQSLACVSLFYQLIAMYILACWQLFREQEHTYEQCYNWACLIILLRRIPSIGRCIV
jgi:hypothetical protein